MKPAVLCAIDKKTDPAVPRISRRPGIEPRVKRPADPRGEGQGDIRFRQRERAGPRRDRRLAPCDAGPRPARDPDDVQTEERVELGSPAEKLLEVAAAESTELIVTGCRGRGTLASALFGSISRALGRYAPCPVVIAPPQAAPGPASDSRNGPAARGIVCGVGSSDRSLAVARLGDELAGRLGDPLLLVHVHETLPYPTEIINYKDSRG